MQYFFSASRWPSASCEPTDSPPRTALMACSSGARATPCCLSRRPVSPLSLVSASRYISLAMNWSPRFCASLSVRLNRLDRSRPTCTSPPCPSILGRRETASLSAVFSALTLPPARASSEPAPLSASLSRASSRCCGSMNWLSLPTARLWASERACCSLVVNLSKRMMHSLMEYLNWPIDGAARGDFNPPFLPLYYAPIQGYVPCHTRHSHTPSAPTSSPL